LTIDADSLDPKVVHAVMDALMASIQEKQGKLKTGEKVCASFDDAVVFLKREGKSGLQVEIYGGEIFRVGHSLEEALDMADLVINHEADILEQVHKRMGEYIERKKRQKERK
jgi:hypothetical protein